MDTDGGVFFKQKNYSRILLEYTSFSKPLLDDFRSALTQLGFTPSKSNSKAVRIQKQPEILRYCDEVGFSNPKHSFKVKYFRKNGVMPSRELLLRAVVPQAAVEKR